MKEYESLINAVVNMSPNIDMGRLEDRCFIAGKLHGMIDLYNIETIAKATVELEIPLYMKQWGLDFLNNSNNKNK